MATLKDMDAFAEKGLVGAFRHSITGDFYISLDAFGAVWNLSQQCRQVHVEFRGTFFEVNPGQDLFVLACPLEGQRWRFEGFLSSLEKPHRWEPVLRLAVAGLEDLHVPNQVYAPHECMGLESVHDALMMASSDR